MVFWVSAFLDLAWDDFERGVVFWARVTGYDVSPRRGEEGEFATLVPHRGGDYLRVQQLRHGSSAVHLDVHVEDPQSAADRAVELGASIVVRHERGYVVLRSPGGLTFCFVSHPASTRPPAARWAGGHRSLVDQVCLDIPASAYDTECGFWAALTGWELIPSATDGEFSSLVRPPGQPLRLLLQRLDEPTGPVRAHLDVSTTDRAAETSRHVALGARVVQEHEHWTVLASPVGTRYCLTDRDPVSGLLA